MYLAILLEDLLNKHNEFFKYFINALKLDETSIISVIPSSFFLIFAAYILHRITHRNVGRRQSIFNNLLYREIGFHWFYLYITRAWFYTVKGFRMSIVYLDQLQEKSGDSETNFIVARFLIAMLYCTISFTPFMMTFMFLSNDFRRQNLLVWLPPNRWARGELGTAGRLMERPLDIIFTEQHRVPAYHTKRSVSTQLPRTQAPRKLRGTKSFYFPSTVSSLQEMIADEEENN